MAVAGEKAAPGKPAYCHGGVGDDYAELAVGKVAGLAGLSREAAYKVLRREQR